MSPKFYCELYRSFELSYFIYKPAPFLNCSKKLRQNILLVFAHKAVLVIEDGFIAVNKLLWRLAISGFIGNLKLL
jgi:hypothetical protein